MLQPKPAKYSFEMASISPLHGGSSFKATKQVKNFFISPITITLEMNGNADLISFSIRIGGTFSPPAVMISSFALPVMNRTPSFVILPLSPE